VSGFAGHPDRRCGAHRPKDEWRAWCEKCNEECHRYVPCVGCARIPLDDLKAEIQSARDRWGDQLGFPPSAWLAILVEEVGEVARIVCDRLSMETGRSDYPVAVEDLYALRTELIQVAAVCVRWASAMRKVL
jgi:NTP pyrophosphatase (non-canonical NTP hydrolase)